MMRAVINSIRMGIFLRQQLTQPSVHQGDLGDRKVSLCNTSLIADDDDRNTQSVQGVDCLGRALDKLDLIRMREVVDLLDDHTVSVQKNCWSLVHGRAFR